MDTKPPNAVQFFIQIRYSTLNFVEKFEFRYDTLNYFNVNILKYYSQFYFNQWLYGCIT